MYTFLANKKRSFLMKPADLSSYKRIAQGIKQMPGPRDLLFSGGASLLHISLATASAGLKQPKTEASP